MNNRITQWLAPMLRQLRRLGPYLLVELVLPGGSVVAMLLWLYQRKAEKL